MSDVVFWSLAASLVLCSLGVVGSRNLYRAAYWLAGALVTTALFYLALTAPLLAAVQILLYTGGVLTLVVYALVITASSDDTTRWRRPVPAALVGLLVFAVLASVALELGDGRAPRGGLDDGAVIGENLFTRYLVPFELLSLLLLGAIFGALAIARREGRS
ncbi:MAG TPA: NADH-quinone oxidoreductase subunit J [Candidatus Polarisedimenticolaceae bacterium]|nr:NADH-quinone oxidoreductase subunit J [Candidatus Polarisedimenticolaceae bacterium]